MNSQGSVNPKSQKKWLHKRASREVLLDTSIKSITPQTVDQEEEKAGGLTK